MNFEINESGHIWLRRLSTGEMSIGYSGSGRVVDVFIKVCNLETSYWNHGTRAFVIKSRFLEGALAELSKAGIRLN